MPDTADRDRQIIYRLLQISQQMLRTREIYAALAGVTPPQFSILTVVAERPGVTIGEVASHLNVTGPFVTTEAGKLVRAGLLDKRASEEDRRRFELHATPEALSRLAHAETERRAANATIFDRFDTAELTALNDALGRLLEGLDSAVHDLTRPDLKP